MIIERGSDGGYSCFVSDETPLKNGLFGYGKTVQEAKDDLAESYREAVEAFGERPDVEFSYIYDTASFLQAFGKRMSLAGLQAITGINRKQLSHYVNGNSRPSKATTERIATGLRRFQRELQGITLL